MSWYEEHAHNSAVLRGVSLIEDVAQRATEEELLQSDLKARRGDLVLEVLRSCVLNVFLGFSG